MKIIKLFFTMIMVMSIISCEQKPSYTISGVISNPDYEGEQVVLLKWGNSSLKPDTTIIVNGKFSFTGYVEDPMVCYLLFKAEPYDRDLFFVVENTKLEVTIDTDWQYTVTGSAYNEEYMKFHVVENELQSNITDAFNRLKTDEEAGVLTPELEEMLRGEIRKNRKELDQLTYDFVKNNINNPAVLLHLRNVLAPLTFEQQKEVVADATPKTLQAPQGKEAVDLISRMEKTNVGKQFTDLCMPDPNGNEIAISDFAGKGKYVLIDFWASWCGPCIAEMPALLEVYNKYKERGKGFEIIGFSLDNKHASWVKSVEDLSLSWPQMSDLKDWNSDGAKTYAIPYVPYTILLDDSGKIIARNLRAVELDKKLNELLK